MLSYLISLCLYIQPVCPFVEQSIQVAAIRGSGRIDTDNLPSSQQQA